jgi:hypothetical protein
MIEILHEVYRFAEEIQDPAEQVRTVGEITATSAGLRIAI